LPAARYPIAESGKERPFDEIHELGVSLAALAAWSVRDEREVPDVAGPVECVEAGDGFLREVLAAPGRKADPLILFPYPNTPPKLRRIAIPSFRERRRVSGPVEHAELGYGALFTISNSGTPISWLER
jgi:hypothetical protein